MSKEHHSNSFEYFFEYLLPKIWTICSHTPLGLIAGVVGGWAYIGYYLVSNRGKFIAPTMVGGWMLCVFVGGVTYGILEVTAVEPKLMDYRLAILVAMILGSTGSTGYKKLVRHAQRLFPEDKE